MTKTRKIKIYDDLRQSLSDALAFERGQALDLRVTKIPAPVVLVTPVPVAS